VSKALLLTAFPLLRRPFCVAQSPKVLHVPADHRHLHAYRGRHDVCRHVQPSFPATCDPDLDACGIFWGALPEAHRFQSRNLTGRLATSAQSKPDDDADGDRGNECRAEGPARLGACKVHGGTRRDQDLSCHCWVCSRVRSKDQR